MSKKTKTKLDVSGAAPALKHNPFGALAGAPAAPSGEPAAEAVPATAPPLAAGGLRGRVVLRRETKHRGGKAVVVVAGLAGVRGLDLPGIEQLARELKQLLGCGGSVQSVGDDHEVLVQGDHPAKVAELLRARGLRVDGVTA